MAVELGFGDSRARMAEALALNEPLAQAYYLKDELRLLWPQSSKTAAATFLDDWCRRTEATGLRVLRTISHTLRGHRVGLLNWYDHPISTKHEFLKPLGEWNTQEVMLQSRKIKIVLNGETIVDCDLDEVTKNGTMDKAVHPGLKRTTGHFDFLGHSDRVDFRNVRIKDLGVKK